MYVPFATHEGLRSSRDDVFFKLCRMHGIAYDASRCTGVVFHLIDSVVSGAVSFMCFERSRRKALDLCTHVLTFLSQKFGKESAVSASSASSASSSRGWQSVSSVLSRVKLAVRMDKMTK